MNYLVLVLFAAILVIMLFADETRPALLLTPLGADTYVSNGPFKLTNWKHDSEVVIEKNKEYWDNKVVNLDKVTYKMVNDATTYYQMFKTKELDLIQTPNARA